MKMIRKLGTRRRFEKNATTVCHYRIGLHIFADLLELELILFNRSIQPFVRYAVAEEELYGFQSGSVVFPSVDAQAPKVRLEEQFPAAQVRLPELFAQLRLSRKQIPELFRCKSNCLDWGFGFDRNDRGPARKQVNVASEVSCPVADKH